MGLSPHVQINFAVYVYFVAVTLEYAAKCMVYLLTKDWINRKAVKAVLFGRDDWTAIVPQRINLRAFVLLHELYPAKEASAAVPVDRAESLSAQSRCKPVPSCSNTNPTQNMDDSELPAFGPQNRTPSTPVFSPMIADPMWLESDKSELSDVAPNHQAPDVSEFVSAPEIDTDPGNGAAAAAATGDDDLLSPVAPYSVLADPLVKPGDELTVSETECALVPTPADLDLLSPGDVSEDHVLPTEGSRLDTETEAMSSPSFAADPQWRTDQHHVTFSASSSDNDDEDVEDDDVEEDDDENAGERALQSQRRGSHRQSLIEFLPSVRSSNDARTSSLTRIGRLTSAISSETPCQPLADQPVPLAGVERTSRRKSVLRPLNQDLGGRSSRSTSQSSLLSDTDRWNGLQEGGCSSDSELDYRMDGGRFFRARGRASASLKPEPSCASLSSILPPTGSRSRSRHPGYPTTSVSSFPVDAGMYGGRDADQHSLVSLRSPPSSSARRLDLLEASDGSSSFRSYPTGSSASSTSRRMERHLRDVDQLELAKVPFTYEQVVYCSNEEFKELRSMPNLTSHQIGAMLDARRRATNRQAAERCRRLKTALRDELSERLAELRLQREQLTRKLIRARQKKQEAKNMLITEQKRILSMLRGPEGDSLNYNDWRVRLTNEDEVVVVAVGR